MPRSARASVGGICYHVLNRGNAKQDVFHKDADYAAFVKLLAESQEQRPMRLLAYCLMPNHFHLVVWPRADGDLSRWMQWLMNAHVRRYHQHYHTAGDGHIWQGRFKAFPVQSDDHLLGVLRYVERNPLRARMVKRAEQWPWSSLSAVTNKHWPDMLHRGPTPRPRHWLKRVHQPLTDAELTAMRRCVNKGVPLGSPIWVTRTANRLALTHTLRGRGRPPKAGRKAE
jgi:putative transposase